MLNEDSEKEPFLNRSKGINHGAITRLMSPGDLGQMLKPFVFLDAVNLDVDGGLGFDWHPHSGIATVTIHFEGASWAEESNGEKHNVPSGGAEWVLAGKGVWHRGGPAEGHKVIKAFQLWLALDPTNELRLAQSQYFSPETLPILDNVKVILGEYKGVKSPVQSPDAITYLQISLHAGESISIEMKAESDARLLAVLEGDVNVSTSSSAVNKMVGPEIGAIKPAEKAITIQAETGAMLVFGSAPKNQHALHLGRYSVHTSEAALAEGEQEIKDLHTALFER